MTSKAATLQEVALLVDGPLTYVRNSETSVALSYLAHPFPKPFQHRQCQALDASFFKRPSFRWKLTTGRQSGTALSQGL